ncbi:DUF6493 family protein [Streptomyces sp. NPDC044984]|uniref:DUF7825 domain-containing protein n=1 Tax=Streptomyces sp. NPDC044984 TaxID=3154335 RepID=UPI003403412E
MSKLIEAVRGGRADDVVTIVNGMTAAERRGELPALKALCKEFRDARMTAQLRAASPALLVAGVACQSGAAAVASWLTASDWECVWVAEKRLVPMLEERPAEWLAELAHRITDRRPSTDIRYHLLEAIVQAARCRMPVTDASVHAWIRDIYGNGWNTDSIAERLRQSPHLTSMVAGLFTAGGTGQALNSGHSNKDNPWLLALARLTAEGTLDRATVLEGCLGRLLRGGTAVDQRVFHRLLLDLELTAEEHAGHTADWLALAADALQPVAVHAQSVLADLALAGVLPTHDLADMTRAVLVRPEKNLVRAQLKLLDKVVARDTATADELLPAAAHAFAHEDTEAQERALKLIERYGTKLTDATSREAVLASAVPIAPGLSARVIKAVGAGPEETPQAAYEDTLPPVPSPVRLAPPPTSVVETAEETGALLASTGFLPVADFERTLDGLVRWAHDDRAALLEALQPVVATRWWSRTYRAPLPDDSVVTGFAHSPLDFTAQLALDLVLTSLHQRVAPATTQAQVDSGGANAGCLPDGPCRARFWEIAHRLLSDPQPFLLSTPTWDNGLLEPGELTDRLETYQRLGARVGECDFAQALLRVRTTDPVAAETAAARAAALGTPEGQQLADWLRTGGLTVTGLHRTVQNETTPIVWSGEIIAFQDLPHAFRELGSPAVGAHYRCHCGAAAAIQQTHWPALLPEHPELIALRLIQHVLHCAQYEEKDPDVCSVLPLLALSPGVSGPAMSLVVAGGLGVQRQEDRLAAVDALLLLAAQEKLDSSALAADLGALMLIGVVTPSRLADSLGTAASTGAYRTVWTVLRDALPPLLSKNLSPAESRGLGELLTVAAECAERTGARGEMSGLDPVADRRGTSRLVSQARRLRAALAGT